MSYEITQSIISHKNHSIDWSNHSIKLINRFHEHNFHFIVTLLQRIQSKLPLKREPFKVTFAIQAACVITYFIMFARFEPHVSDVRVLYTKGVYSLKNIRQTGVYRHTLGQRRDQGQTGTVGAWSSFCHPAELPFAFSCDVRLEMRRHRVLTCPANWNKEWTNEGMKKWAKSLMDKGIENIWTIQRHQGSNCQANRNKEWTDERMKKWVKSLMDKRLGKIWTIEWMNKAVKEVMI